SSAWWARMFAADARLVAAAAAPDAAIPHLRIALATLEGITAPQTQTYYQRRLARVQLLLARALTAAGIERSRVVELATAARDWYRDAGGYDAAVAELDALVTGSR
ncbi:MAG: hypothetical protein M3680_35100, partial [Myxococcota bacterium]|nr:hypothetical protein [Myxococcota bacterium]